MKCVEQETLCVYSFFIIVDTKTNEFKIFSTSMKDWRLRYSAMKSSFKRWAAQDFESQEFPEREYFRFFKSQYICAYILDKGQFTQSEAEKHITNLTKCQRRCK